MLLENRNRARPTLSITPWSSLFLRIRTGTVKNQPKRKSAVPAAAMTVPKPPKGSGKTNVMSTPKTRNKVNQSACHQLTSGGGCLKRGRSTQSILERKFVNFSSPQRSSVTSRNANISNTIESISHPGFINAACSSKFALFSALVVS